MDEEEFQRFIDWHDQPRRPLRRGEFPSPDDFDRMSIDQFERYIEAIGFAQQIRESLVEPVAADRMGRAIG